MRSRVLGAWALAAAIPLLASGVAYGQQTPPNAPPEPSAEQRQKMAEIHRAMADCLASTRPFAECRNEMHASCQSQLGQTGCPMMGGWGYGMGGGKGRMGGGMMSPPTGTTPPSQPNPAR